MSSRREAGDRDVGDHAAQVRARIGREFVLHVELRVVENAGDDGAVVVGKLLESKDYAWGYDAQSGEYRDMVKAGIIDPTKVVRTAIQDAASVAGLLITTEPLVAEHCTIDDLMKADLRVARVVAAKQVEEIVKIALFEREPAVHVGFAQG